MRSLCLLAALLTPLLAGASPDEAVLGKESGYPRATNSADAFTEPYRVGSFSAMDRFLPHCTLKAAAQPLPLARTEAEPVIRYRYAGGSYTLDDYLQHQRATAVLVVQGDTVVAERYGYDRTAAMRMLSNSMAKTVVALGIGKALEEGRIRSLDDTAQTYAPEIAGTLYGGTRIVNLLRMASGARFTEDYSGHDDHARFNRAVRNVGSAKAAATITERDAAEGERFNYASAQTQILGLVLRGATGRSLCDYLGEKIWGPLGAAEDATWLVNPFDRIEGAGGGLNATARDYARLGLLLARDGEARGRPVVPRDWVLAMTDAERQPLAFRPGRMEHRGSTAMGYGLQVWLLPGPARRFVLLGIHGQAIYVDPALKLVMVHLAVGKDASGDASGAHLGAERAALWRGVLAQFGADGQYRP